MGLYRDRIAPRLTHLGCGSGRVRSQRARIVPDAEGVVVEIGMGSAHNLALYRPDRVRHVIGVEPHPEMARLAASNIASSPVPAEIVEGFAESMPLDDDCADTVVLTFTLCSVADAERALREIRRVLKPAGRLLVLEHGLSADAGVARWQRRVDPVWTRLAAGCHVNRPISHLVEAAGFSFESLDTGYLQGAPKFAGWLTRGAAIIR